MTVLDELLATPGHERESAVMSCLVQTLKPYLHTDDNEDLPVDQNLFDLGLNSLGVENCRHVLEGHLKCRLDVAQIYNQPTLAELSDYIQSVVFQEQGAQRNNSEMIENRSMIEGLLAKMSL